MTWPIDSQKIHALLNVATAHAALQYSDELVGGAAFSSSAWCARVWRSRWIGRGAFCPRAALAPASARLQSTHELKRNHSSKRFQDLLCVMPCALTPRPAECCAASDGCRPAQSMAAKAKSQTARLRPGMAVVLESSLHGVVGQMVIGWLPCRRHLPCGAASQLRAGSVREHHGTVHLGLLRLAVADDGLHRQCAPPARIIVRRGASAAVRTLHSKGGWYDLKRAVHVRKTIPGSRREAGCPLRTGCRVRMRDRTAARQLAMWQLHQHRHIEA